MIGQVLAGRYRIISQLGAGGFSKTYLVHDRYLPNNALCVVKQLYFEGHNTLTEADVRQMFEREANILQQLGRSHDCIPTLLAHIEEDSNAYLVVEFTEGDILESYLRQGKLLTAKEATKLLKDVLALLTFIHDLGIIHQDIKPGNLICRKSDKAVCLIDFGSATKIKEPPFKDLILGTPGYTPPEQQAGEAIFASDLYALGVTIVQLLTGIHPQQFRRHPVTNDFDWQGYLKSRSIPAPLKEILNKLIKPNPAQRYQTASEVLIALSEPKRRRDKALPDSKGIGNDSVQQSLPRPKRGSFGAALVANRAPQVLKWGAGLATLGAIGIAISSGQWNSPIRSTQETVKTYITEVIDQAAKRPKLLRSIEAKGMSKNILITAQNYIVTANTDDSVQVWNLATGSLIRKLDNVPKGLTKLAVSPNGQWLLAANKEKQVAIWDLPTGKLERFFTLSGAIEEAAFNPNNSDLAISTTNSHMQIWNLKTQKIDKEIEEAASPDAQVTSMIYQGDLLICGTQSQRLMLWNFQTGTLQKSLLGHTKPVRAMQVSTDEKTLYSFGADRAVAWNTNTGEIKQVFSQESSNIVEARWNRSNLITRQEDGTIQLWNPTSGHLLETLAHVNGLAALSPDAQYLVNYDSSKITVWQLPTSY